MAHLPLLSGYNFYTLVVLHNCSKTFSSAANHTYHSARALRPIHTKRVYVRLRPSTDVDLSLIHI